MTDTPDPDSRKWIIISFTKRATILGFLQTRCCYTSVREFIPAPLLVNRTRSDLICTKLSWHDHFAPLQLTGAPWACNDRPDTTCCCGTSAAAEGMGLCPSKVSTQHPLLLCGYLHRYGLLFTVGNSLP